MYYDESNMRHQCDLRDYIDWLGQSMHYVKSTAREVLSKGDIAGVIVKHQESL